MSSSTRDPLYRLGPDVLLHVLEKLDPKSLIDLSAVSREWRDHLHSNDRLWRTVCRRAGVDLKEWSHIIGERVALQVEEPYVPPDVSSYELAERDYDLGMGAYDCRAAFRDHDRLEQAWEKRYVYEMLLPAPAFRLRDVYMDHEEDTIYALTQTSIPSRDEHLLVFHKYTGVLLLRIPVRAEATIVVGGGYVAVSEHSRSDTNHPTPSPLGAVTVYRSPRAACRAAARQNGAQKEWKHRELPLEYHLTLNSLRRCLVMKVGLVNGEGVLVAADYVDKVVHLCHLDTNRTTQFSYDDGHSHGSTTNDSRDRAGEIRLAVHIDDDYVFIVLRCSLLIYSHNGKRLLAYPDSDAPREDIVTSVYHVAPEMPYSYSPSTRPSRPDEALPGIDIADTLAWKVKGYCSWGDAETIDDLLAEESGPFMGEEGSDERPAFDLNLQDVYFTRNHLVIRADTPGGAFVVAGYRKLLAQCAKMEEAERADFIGQHTTLIAIQFSPDVVATNPYSDRVAFHTPVACLLVIDLSNFRPLPRYRPQPISQLDFFAGARTNMTVVRDLRAVADVLLDRATNGEPEGFGNISATAATGNDLNENRSDTTGAAEDHTADMAAEDDHIQNGIGSADIQDNDDETHDEETVRTHDEEKRTVDDNEPNDELPGQGDPPTIPAFVFEISCLESMAEQSSIVMDSRAVYMCDWDKGRPDPSVDYEELHVMEAFEDEWEWAIRANFGHIKIWTFRPEAALLRRQGVSEWQQETREALERPRNAWAQAEAAMLAEAERRRNYDWADALDGMVWLGIRDAEDEENGESETGSSEGEGTDSEDDWSDE